jgi:hypothetical protein
MWKLRPASGEGSVNTSDVTSEDERVVRNGIQGGDEPDASRFTEVEKLSTVGQIGLTIERWSPKNPGRRVRCCSVLHSVKYRKDFYSKRDADAPQIQ